MSLSLPRDRRSWRAFAEQAFGVRLITARTGNALVPAGARSLVASPSQAARFLSAYLVAQTAEVFCAILLDAQSRSLTAQPVEITRGLLDQSPVHPRELFRGAILANAHSVIIAHNHPSGDPTPSFADRQVTTAMVSAGQLLEVPVRDHVVIGPTATGYVYSSFAEAGLL